MTNLFDTIQKLSDEALREQIALFEVLTMSNVYKEAGHKVAKQLIKATNVVTELIKKAPLQELEAFSIEEALTAHQAANEEIPREALEEIFKKVLRERCDLEEDATEEALAVYMIDEAGELYELKEELLPSQKADWIAKFYQDELTAATEEGASPMSTYSILKPKLSLDRTKLLRHLFVQCIAAILQASGAPMTVDNECLPSWAVWQERIAFHQTYEEKVGQCEKNTVKYDQVLQTFLENNQRIALKNKLIEDEENKQEEMKGCIAKLQEERSEERRVGKEC